MAIYEGSFTNAKALKVGIVIARFNDLITTKILAGCLDCLKRHGIDTSENRIGINTIYPQYEIDVSGGGTINTDTLIINKLIINDLPDQGNINNFPIGTVYSENNFLKIRKI